MNAGAGPNWVLPGSQEPDQERGRTRRDLQVPDRPTCHASGCRVVDRAGGQLVGPQQGGDGRNVGMAGATAVSPLGNGGSTMPGIVPTAMATGARSPGMDGPECRRPGHRPLVRAVERGHGRLDRRACRAPVRGNQPDVQPAAPPVSCTLAVAASSACCGVSCTVTSTVPAAERVAATATMRLTPPGEGSGSRNASTASGQPSLSPKNGRTSMPGGLTRRQSGSSATSSSTCGPLARLGAVEYQRRHRDPRGHVGQVGTVHHPEERPRGGRASGGHQVRPLRAAARRATGWSASPGPAPCRRRAAQPAGPGAPRQGGAAPARPAAGRPPSPSGPSTRTSRRSPSRPGSPGSFGGKLGAVGDAELAEG